MEKWFRWGDNEHPVPTDRAFTVQLSNGYMTTARMHGGSLYADAWGQPTAREEIVQPIAWRELPKAFKAPRTGASKDKYTPEFETVWATYPARPNSSKWDAFRAFRNCTAAEQKLIAEIMPAVARSLAGTEARYLPHLSTWINGKRFETFNAPQKPTASAQPCLTENEWHGILRRYEMTSNWNVMAYGPPPGQPGCRVPSNLL